jgi:hypothetical protein
MAIGDDAALDMPCSVAAVVGSVDASALASVEVVPDDVFCDDFEHAAANAMLTTRTMSNTDTFLTVDRSSQRV